MDGRILDEDAVTQLCFVTDDLDRTVTWFGDLTGHKPGAVIQIPHDEARAIYMGKHAKFGCRIQFFFFGNIELEIIEPGPERSVWRDVLDKKGPTFHHIAFKTRNMKKRAAYLESKGHELMQSGEFTGGRYAYFNTAPELGALIELLEFDKDKEPQ
jgi:catechol 2,3-dioxygenase-like lactoylglutathione lyase family enzyme